MIWNPFSKHVDEETAQTTVQEPFQSTGKGRPTPKRKQAEQQNLRPLVPKDRKAATKEAKTRTRAKENAEYDAMRSGDVAHMPKAERLPWRVYIRDYVDARFNIGEFFIPATFVILLVTMVMSIKWPALANPFLMLMYVYLLIAVIDVAFMWRKLRKLLVEKYGEAAVGKGSRSASYAWSRAIQLRRWRLPKPRYPKRGHWPK
jgi:hypothetical protein